MRKFITAAATAAVLATSGIAATAPADAQRWGGHGGWHGGYGGYRGGYGGYRGGWHHHGGVGAGTAVAAGILGLGVGAAIGSSNRGYYDGGYGGGYYAYAPPPPPPVYYAPAPVPYYGYYGY
jgi:hypothetical protein